MNGGLVYVNVLYYNPSWRKRFGINRGIGWSFSKARNDKHKAHKLHKRAW